MLIHTAHRNSHHQDEYIFNENSPNNFHFATVTGWGIDPTFCVSISFCRLGWNREEPCAWGSWIQSVTGSEKIAAAGEMSRCAYNCCKSVVTEENHNFENIMFGTFSIYMHRTCYFDVCFQYELSIACVEFDWGVVENGCVAATSWSTSTFEQRAWDSEASHHGAEVQKFAMPQLCGGFRGRFSGDVIHISQSG